MIQLPAGYTPLNPLPEAFGTAGFRARRDADGLAVLLLAAGGSEGLGPQLGAAADLWAAAGGPGLCPLVDRRDDGSSAVFVFRDEGGPLLAELPEAEWLTWAEAWLDQWEARGTGAAAWSAFDPRRILAGPGGPRSFDLIHLAGPVPGPVFPPVSATDLRLSAPELTGRTAWTAGQASGLFSWGAAVCRSVTGEWPLAEEDRLTMVHALLSRETQLPGLPADPGLRAILAKLLGKDPRRRYLSLAGLRWDLAHRRDPDWEAPGLRDRRSGGTEPGGLYGRDAQVERLTAAVAGTEAGAFGLLLLAGEGGAGKSRLAAEATREADLRGLGRLTGKFEAGEGRFATGAVVQALNAWTAALKVGPPADRSRWVELVRRDLGKALSAVAGLVPDLAGAADETAGSGPSEPEQSDRRFTAAVAALFRLAAAVRPLMLVVEDLQWADESSLLVLERLAADTPRGLLLLLTSRPSEASDRFADQAGTEVLSLGPLDPDAVEALAAEATGIEGPPRSEFARTLLRLCDGTPYHLRLLLREAARRQSVVYDPAENRWRFRPETLGDLPPHGITEVLSRRLADLGPEARQALVRSALAGSEFTLAEAGAAEPLVRGLSEAGIWTAAGAGRLRFTHDRSRELALSFATEEAAAEAHLALGRERLARWQEGAGPGPAAAADHLNAVADRLTDREAAGRRAANLAAATALRSRGDRASALQFFRSGLEASDPALGWEVYRDAADTAYAERQRGPGDQWSDEAVRRAPEALQRALIRERQQAYLFFLGDPDASVAAGLRGLRELDISLRAEPGPLRLAADLAAVELALRGRPASVLATLPENRDPVSRAALLLLAGFVPPAFLSSQLNLFGVAVLRGTLLTLKTGLCAESAPAFTGYAVLLAALGRRRKAYEFGMLAVDLNRRFDDPVWRSMVLTLTGLFGVGWIEGWDRLGPWFADARAAAVESGDVVYLSFAQLFETLWNPREELSVRLRRTEEAITAIRRNRYPGTLVSALFLRGSLRLLGAPAPGPLDFSGADFDPDRGLAEVAALKSDSGLAVCHTTMLAAAFLAGDLEAARRSASKAQALRSSVAGSLYEEELLLYRGLLSADLVRRGDRPARKALAAEARKAASWARDSRMFAFHAALLRAEADDVSGRILEAQSGFLKAVAAADAAGMAAHQALARERTARFFAFRGLEGPAALYRAEAADRWARYGARAQAARLAAVPGASVLSPARPEAESWDVDLLGLVRAIDAVAASPRLDDLIRTISQLMLETSGADRVVFLVPEEGGWRVRGEAGLGPGGVGRLLIDRGDLPRSVVQRTARDLQPVVWESIAESERRKEPVLAARGVKALLCLPLAVNRELRALVYLENRVAEGILTRQRISGLERLSSTLAVSLENARLFDQIREAKDDLEKRVEARTRELRASERRVVQQEKMASLGALTAGIAHELKNPLNLTTNFAEASLELLNEAEALWVPFEDRLTPDQAENWAYLKRELGQNLRTVVDQGRRGNGIIRTMLLHSRRDPGEPAEEAVAPLVQESVVLAFHGMKASREEFRCQVDESYDPAAGSLRMIRANLGRVLLNLLTNAFQAVDERRRRGEAGYEPAVAVGVFRQESGVRITVEDNGGGIAPEALDRIFEPFFTTKPPGEGTGLGLSISYDIVVKELGGTVEADSRPGGPTRFTVLLPRVPSV